ncbi:MAG: hypothetical protein AAGB15_09355 [Pseudomonadota bacterium]
MVRYALALPAILIMAACDPAKYTAPIAPKPHGQAVRANMAAQIINPEPPVARRPELTDAARTTLAREAYRQDEVQEPSREDAAASTAQVK